MKADLFELRQTDRTVFLTLIREPRPMEGELLDGDPGGVFELLDRVPGINVVVDCGNVPVCFSSTVVFFIRLWKKTVANHGRIAFCNASPHLLQEFEVLHLNGMWPMFGSLSEAIEHVEK